MLSQHTASELQEEESLHCHGMSSTVLCAEHLVPGQTEVPFLETEAFRSWSDWKKRLGSGPPELSVPAPFPCLSPGFISCLKAKNFVHYTPHAMTQVCCDQQLWPEPSETASQNKLSALVSARHFGHSDLAITNILVYGPGVMAKWP